MFPHMEGSSRARMKKRKWLPPANAAVEILNDLKKFVKILVKNFIENF